MSYHRVASDARKSVVGKTRKYFNYASQPRLPSAYTREKQPVVRASSHLSELITKRDRELDQGIVLLKK